MSDIFYGIPYVIMILGRYVGATWAVLVLLSVLGVSNLFIAVSASIAAGMVIGHYLPLILWTLLKNSIAAHRQNLTSL